MKTAIFFRARIAAVVGTVLFTLAGPPAWGDDPTPFPPATSASDAEHTPPKLLRRVEATYPKEGDAARGDVRVFVAFIVNNRGEVKNASAMFGPPAPFAKAAVAAVEQWTFEPGRLRERAVATQMTVAIWFKAAPDSAPR